MPTIMLHRRDVVTLNVRNPETRGVRNETKMNIDKRYRSIFSGLAQDYARSVVRHAVFVRYEFLNEANTETKIMKKRGQDISDILSCMKRDSESCRDFIDQEIRNSIPMILLDFEFSYEERLNLMNEINKENFFWIK